METLEGATILAIPEEEVLELESPGPSTVSDQVVKSPDPSTVSD